MVIAPGLLHFLEKQISLGIIEKMKASTNPNGINHITTFRENDPMGYDYAKCLFGVTELPDLYKDWKIIKYETYMTPLHRHHDDDKMHQHAIAGIIARKI